MREDSHCYPDLFAEASFQSAHTVTLKASVEAHASCAQSNSIAENADRWRKTINRCVRNLQRKASKLKGCNVILDVQTVIDIFTNNEFAITIKGRACRLE